VARFISNETLRIPYGLQGYKRISILLECPGVAPRARSLVTGERAMIEEKLKST
jgi:hypothetical protein